MTIINEHLETHEFLCEELLVPNADKSDANRLYMWSGHLAQCANLKEPENPLVRTNFENMFGEYSDLGFYDLDDDTVVLGKVKKNDNVFYLIIYKQNKDEYDIVERREEFWLTEKYGFTFNNDVIDNVVEGEALEKGTRLYKSHNYDEDDNFRIGVNLRAIYFTEKCKTLEDAFIISESAAKKFTSYNVEKVMVVLNDNDLLLNQSDDEDEYKCFPDIGERVDKYLCVRRRINLKKIYGYDNIHIETVNPDDEKFFVEGQVADINIYSNLEEDKLDAPYNKQIKKLYNKRKKFNKEFLKITEEFIIDNPEKCSSELVQIYNSIKMEQNKIPFAYENGTFKGVVIEFTIIKENKLVIGSKISGR